MGVRSRFVVGLSFALGVSLLLLLSPASIKDSAASTFASSSAGWSAYGASYRGVQGVESGPLLRGNSSDGLFDRLMPDVNYMTSGRAAGLTNQVIAAINLIYLSVVTGRVPILPPFHANNQLSKTPIPDLPVSLMFDLARMNREMVDLRGVLEWEDLQTDKGVPEPEVGCWGGMRKNNALEFAKIKVTWTDYPGLTFPPKARYMSWVQFIPYLTPSSPFYHRFVATKVHPSALAPNDQFACIDETMDGTDFADMGPYNEYAAGFGGWRWAGTFLRFREELVEQGRVRLRKAFGIAPGQDIPPFVTMHIRHGDFTAFCGKGDPCFTVAQFAFQLDLLKKELTESGRPVPLNVLVMSDESDPKFFEQVKARGWKMSQDGEGVQNPKLVEELGGWHDTLIDNVLLASGDHFIGTISSTMSLLGSLRTKDWNGGLSRMVGFKDPELPLH
ncbi:hypothetical protein BDY24DRAFT_383901 [Mrakia frigida]|uniref:uncharacterized protein n=1 Tax=Mrakia frigida TaxID=29902 RepID=UPI003FCC250A